MRQNKAEYLPFFSLGFGDESMGEREGLEAWWVPVAHSAGRH